ncbi:MAG: hypothetical protein HYX67_01435 [Candidatus Melainabacteria bacterium]|nr:hypothetical protein [Candidatus Melainabacteria bacterium]
MRHKEKSKSAYRIVSDPFAPEEEWMAAALSLPQVVKTETRTSILEQARKISSFRNVTALAIMTISSVFLVRGGYDWGYKVVDLMFSQDRALNQGIIANFSIAHIVFPVCFGILIAGRVRGNHVTKLKWILAVSVIGAAVWDSLVDDDLFFRAGELAFAATSGVVAYLLTRWNRARLRVSNLNLPELWNLPVLGTLIASSAIVAFTSTERFFALELIAYTVAIGLISYLSRSSVRSKRPDFESALLVLSPIFVCNALNVILNLLSLAFDPVKMGADLGWRALLSAVLINCVAYAALYAGLRFPKSIGSAAKKSRLLALGGKP